MLEGLERCVGVFVSTARLPFAYVVGPGGPEGSMP